MGDQPTLWRACSSCRRWTTSPDRVPPTSRTSKPWHRRARPSASSSSGCAGFTSWTVAMRSRIHDRNQGAALLTVGLRVARRPDGSVAGTGCVLATRRDGRRPQAVSEVWSPVVRRARVQAHRPTAPVWVLTDDFPFLNLVAPLADGPVLPEDRAAVELLLSLTSAEQGASYHLPQRVPR